MTSSAVAQWPIVGHEWAVEHLDRAIRHGRVRHAYLFTGPDRIGKTTLARVFAMTLNCTGANSPCGQCRACTLIARNVHPDVTVVEAASMGSALRIEQVRDLQQTLALCPYEARYRVAILRRFHEANPAAANALLKTLEEPSPDVVLILTANSADRLLPTIVSRCQPLNLHPVPVHTVREALEQGWGAPGDVAQTLAQLSGGRIGWAIGAVENPAELEQRDLALFLLRQALHGSRRDRFALVEQLALEKPALFDLLEVWQGYWRDALLVASGSRAPITNYDHAEELTHLAETVGLDVAGRALAATRRTIDALGKNVNTRLALEVLMLDYPVS
ncbi:MAG TPA: DNA polymerase III subunit delta' [Aggregatilineaceae bacterium]|nr:DNA polymerase III subunit delta' [Aggregatilineaceae bacterium]